MAAKSGACACAALSLCAKELACLVRFSRATSALEPPPCAAVLLPSAALLQLLCSTKLPVCRFLSLKPFLLKTFYSHYTKKGAKQKRNALLFRSASPLVCARKNWFVQCVEIGASRGCPTKALSFIFSQKLAENPANQVLLIFCNSGIIH